MFFSQTTRCIHTNRLYLRDTLPPNTQHFYLHFTPSHWFVFLLETHLLVVPSAKSNSDLQSHDFTSTSEYYYTGIQNACRSTQQLSSGCFCIVSSVLSIMYQYEYIFIYPAWGSLSLLDIRMQALHLLWKILSYCIFGQCLSHYFLFLEAQKIIQTFSC